MSKKKMMRSGAATVINVIDLHQFEVPGKGLLLAETNDTDEILKTVLADLPSIDELEMRGSARRMVRLSGSDGSVFFAVASNTKEAARHFYGWEAGEGRSAGPGDWEWFIIVEPDTKPRIMRQSDLQKIAAGGGGAQAIRASSLSSVQLLQRSPEPA